MDSLKVEEVAINLALMKKFHFYQFFEPDGVKIFGWNVHRFVCILFIMVSQSIMVYAAIGLITDVDLADYELVLVLSAHLENYVGLSKLMMLLFNVNKIWNLFDVARLNFLKSKLCRGHVKILEKRRDQTIKMTNAYFIFTSVIMTEWVIFPIVLNLFFAPVNINEYRLHNIFDFRYPVSLHTYNEFYLTFYLLDLIIGAFMLFTAHLSDMIILSICWVLSSQYEVLTRGFKGIGHGEYILEEDKEVLRSILFDQQQVFLKLKSFTSVIGSTIIIFVVINSGIIITQTYTLISVLTTPGISILTILKVGTTILYVSSQLFIYSYLFDDLNFKRDGVNYGIYSCNWTNMSLKFKKLLLLAMQLNDVNQVVIKSTPKKIFNLQLFASVMSTSFNILSVLLKTMNKKRTVN